MLFLWLQEWFKLSGFICWFNVICIYRPTQHHKCSDNHLCLTCYMFRPAISAIIRRYNKIKVKTPLLYRIKYKTTNKLPVAVSLQAFITSRVTGGTNPFIHNLDTKWRWMIIICLGPVKEPNVFTDGTFARNPNGPTTDTPCLEDGWSQADTHC